MEVADHNCIPSFSIVFSFYDILFTFLPTHKSKLLIYSAHSFLLLLQSKH